MMTPQLTEQYGQVLRVSVVREILRVFACATTGATSRPKAETATPPAREALRNVRREIAMANLRDAVSNQQRRYQSSSWIWPDLSCRQRRPLPTVGVQSPTRFSSIFS